MGRGHLDTSTSVERAQAVGAHQRPLTRLDDWPGYDLPASLTAADRSISALSSGIVRVDNVLGDDDARCPPRLLPVNDRAGGDSEAATRLAQRPAAGVPGVREHVGDVPADGSLRTDPVCTMGSARNPEFHGLHRSWAAERCAP